MGFPRSKVSKKWLIRNIEVEMSPLPRSFWHWKAVLFTASYGVSQMLLNSVGVLGKGGGGRETQDRPLTINQVWRCFEIGRRGQESDQASSGVNQTAKSWPATCGQRSRLGGVRQGINPRSHEYGGELRSCEIVRVDNEQSHDWRKSQNSLGVPTKHPPSSG